MKATHEIWLMCSAAWEQMHESTNPGADPGFLDQGFKLAEGSSICAVWPIFPEIPHENEII